METFENGKESIMASKEKPQEKPKFVHASTGSMVRVVWSISWMFTITIAFAKLIGWKAILALVIWPYYWGLAVR